MNICDSCANLGDRLQMCQFIIGVLMLVVILLAVEFT